MQTVLIEFHKYSKSEEQDQHRSLFYMVRSFLSNKMAGDAACAASLMCN